MGGHDGRLVHERDHTRIDAEARLDGIYVLRTSELAPRRHGAHLQGLADVERWFRTLKGLDIRVRLVRHARNAGSARICLLAGYLEWRLRRAAHLIETFPVPETPES